MSHKWIRRTAIVFAVLLVTTVGGFVWFERAGPGINLVGFTSESGRAPLEVPEGFTVDIYAEGLDAPRLIALGPDGVPHVADRSAGRIVALPDDDGDGTADTLLQVADDLDGVHSLAWHEGAWYVGVPSGIVRLDDEDGDGTVDGRTTIIGDIPSSGNHTTRTVAFLPDGRMLLSVGSSCNVCVEEDPRRGAIVGYAGPDGDGESLYATGLRNAVGLTIHPDTGQLWATNNGRDLLGPDEPPETINAVDEGDDFGWPHCINGRTIDPDEGTPGDCEGIKSPAVEYQAHTAPLGLSFYDGAAFPAAYRGDLFVANHGSWNREDLVGYDVIRIPFEDGAAAGEPVPFVTGWLTDDGSRAYGRPVGLVVATDGALLISDDKAGIIYRVAAVSGPSATP